MALSLHQQIAAENIEIKNQGKWKEFRLLKSPMSAEVEMEGRGKVLVLSSNNYLGLSDHPEVIKAGKDALDKYGAGTASVRFICGYFEPHKTLEDELARMHQTEAALSYVSCWQTNTGVIPSLTGEGDAILSDELNHASIIDGCRMSKAKKHAYKHNDMSALEQKLKEVQGARRILVITDGVFSMEGSIAKLPDIISLCKKYGAALMMDDCHGVGVLGKHGRGTAEYFGVEGKIDIITGTLGKALGGAAGGYVASSKAVIDYLNQSSRPQLFSNALPATVAASALKAVQIMQSEPERVAKIPSLASRMREGLKANGLKPLDGDSGIVPIILGETKNAIAASAKLLDEGIFVTGFGFPVVPEGTARLRIQISASLTEQHIDFAVQKITKVVKEMGAA